MCQHQLCLLSLSLKVILLFFFIDSTSLSQAQVVSDNTLPVSTVVSSVDGQNFLVTEGTRVGEQNLFHSFSSFSVPADGSVVFENPNVENIFGRVTGASMSQIDGLIQASSNLFLINPRGITFGLGSQIDINGSFIVSTANQINFADGLSFNVETAQAPMLTMSMPIGLQLGSNSASIRTMGSSFEPFLEGQPGSTFALLGNGIFLSGIFLSIPSGRVELGSVLGPATVDIAPAPEGFTLGFENAQNFQDISLSDGAFIDTTGNAAGPVRLYGKDISISQLSGVSAFNFLGDLSGAKIDIKAENSLILSDGSSINVGDGSEGLISIETQELILRNFSIIDASTVFSGKNNNLIVHASELVELQGGSMLTNSTVSDDAGVVEVLTKQLRLIDGGGINTTTFSTLLGNAFGNAGDIEIEATESIVISGSSPNGGSPSNLFSGTVDNEGTEQVTTGDGGDISIKTNFLTLDDGGIISLASVGESLGEAGDLNIQANGILLLNNSAITTDAVQSTTGGNITINSGVIFAQNNSDITANAVEGSGGQIELIAQGIFGLTERTFADFVNLPEPDPSLLLTNDVTAFSQLGGPSLAGTIIFQTPEIDPSEGLIDLPTTVIDASRLVAKRCLSNTESLSDLGELIVTGRGGLAASPNDLLSGNAVRANWILSPHDNHQGAQKLDTKIGSDALTALPAAPPQIIEAQSWQRTPTGELMLVAQANTRSIEQLAGRPQTHCAS